MNTPQVANFPSRVTLELTNRCNISCTFCPRHNMGGALGAMPEALAKRLIGEMAGHLPITLVPFLRGESLLHPQWHSIIAYAVSKGVGPVQFTTNATLLDRENTAKLLQCGVDFISFSLDTVDPLLYEKTRRGADYRQVIGNILYFLECNAAQKNPLTVQVSAVETAAHAGGIKDFVEFWQPRVDRVRIYPEHSADGHPGSLPGERKEVRRPCLKLFQDMVILWNGDVAICNHDWQRQKHGEVFANVNSCSMQEAWTGAEYNRLREKHQSGCLVGVKPCEHCAHWQAFYLPEKAVGRVFSKNNQRVKQP